ncbi:zinc finger protein ZAT4-like [Punica granatum]|uniref:C2H2-type domain-containing protein n=2 Tax=Punica granatum TaxID=22663 RepID=A0A218Y0M7_PUNGR|nr:zinc finger protein ZAT4-like [Punica granatum]OWM90389.1 hypothetical protein CDL15_Pgr014691 [Punica granatum]PKI77960.1 hypothetical protein CRG98_001580 [Punica granatum]
MKERRDDESEEVKHECKLCSKSFPCGRSLGGHMKSHLKDSAAAGYGYGLRKNPKKMGWRASEFTGGDDPSSVPPCCRECGRKFGSWKGLFGHMMKRHLVNNSDRLKEDEEEEEGFDCLNSQFWGRDSSNTVTDSQSSDNQAGFPNRKKRSQQRKRHNTTKVLNSSSSSDHVADIEQELEEVAVCLMMLSRDFFNGSSGTGIIDSSMVDSSDNNSVSVFLKDPTRNENKDCHSPPKGSNARTELSVSWNFKNQSKVNQEDIISQSGIENPESGKNLDGMDKNQVKPCKVRSSTSKRKFSDVSDDSRPRKSSSKRLLAPDGSEEGGNGDLDKGINSRFECNTCNKIFQSYQALGGHRASHRKAKAGSGSKDNSIETEQSPPGEVITAEGTEIETANPSSKRKRKKEAKGDEHECPVCLRVFPSGQALGGHKRSHMPEAKNSQTRLPAIPKPAAHKVRDFLDLNLPAPLEEEEEGGGGGGGTNSSIVSFKPWWGGRSHKQEPAIGLIAN